jgi:hypothetical protein
MNTSDSEKMILMEKQLQIMNAYADDRCEANSYRAGYSQSYMYNAGDPLYNNVYKERMHNEQENCTAQCSNNAIVSYGEQCNSMQTTYYMPINLGYEMYPDNVESIYYQLPVNEQQYNAINYSNNMIVTYVQPITYQQLNDCCEYDESHNHNTSNSVVEYSQDESKDELPKVERIYGASYTNNAVINQGVKSLQDKRICVQCSKLKSITGITAQQIISHMALRHNKCYKCESMQEFKSREEIRKHSFEHHPGTAVTMQTARNKRNLKDRDYITRKDRSTTNNDYTHLKNK